MPRRTRLAAALAAVLALPALTVTTATAAHAADHELSMVVTYETAGLGQVVFHCHALATGHLDPTVTAITDCTFHGSSAPDFFLRGAYSVTSGVATTPLASVVEVCMSAFAIWSDGHQVDRPLTCRNAFVDYVGLAPI